MRPLVLDAEALNALIGPGSPRQRAVRAALTSAVGRTRPVVVPAVVLAELCRGRRRTAAVDSFLAREERVVDVRDTDRALARYVGSVLAAAEAGSELMADAHTVAVAVEAGGGVVLTADPEDVGRLAAHYPAVMVAAL